MIGDIAGPELLAGEQVNKRGVIKDVLRDLVHSAVIVLPIFWASPIIVSGIVKVGFVFIVCFIIVLGGGW